MFSPPGMAHRPEAGPAAWRRLLPGLARRDRPGNHRATELTQALAKLPAKQKQAIAYHYLAGLPYAEVAAIFGGSADAARRAAADGIAALRRSYPGAPALKGVPGDTVRGWLRRAAGRAGQVRVVFTRLAAELSADPVPLEPAGSPLADALVAAEAA
jgi:hypothetical protein